MKGMCEQSKCLLSTTLTTLVVAIIVMCLTNEEVQTLSEEVKTGDLAKYQVAYRRCPDATGTPRTSISIRNGML